MKRKKMLLSDMINNGINYFNFNRVKNNSGVRGWRYILDKPLTKEQITFILNFKNVVIGECNYKYAPELKYNTLIIFDKCIK